MKKVDTYICITELLGCTFEANTTLFMLQYKTKIFFNEKNTSFYSLLRGDIFNWDVTGKAINFFVVEACMRFGSKNYSILWSC